MENSKSKNGEDKKNIDKETEILKSSLDFLKDYIDLIDDCIICMRSNLRCSLKNEIFDTKNPNGCHVIVPINAETDCDTFVKYLKFNHYNKIRKGLYNNDVKKPSDVLLSYDQNQYIRSIDQKFRDILQRLTENVLQNRCAIVEPIDDTTTTSFTSIRDINNKNNDQKITQLPIKQAQESTNIQNTSTETQARTTSQVSSTTKQENTTIEEKSELYNKSNSVAKKCFALVLITSLLLRLFKY
ncbi:hypothetical protein BDAP_002381 [Binucleata daphniae]